MPRGPGFDPIAHYPFDGNADDVSGSDLDGTVVGATFTSGVFGQALDLSDVDGWVELPPLLDAVDGCSLSFWARIERYDDRFDLNTILAEIPEPARGRDRGSAGPIGPSPLVLDVPLDRFFPSDPMRGLDPGDVILATIPDQSMDPTAFPVTMALPSGWHHYALVWESSLHGSPALRFYINGVERGTVDRPFAAPCGNFSGITVGAYDPFGKFADYFSGQIDDLQIYDVALSSGDVEGLFMDARLVSSGRIDLQIPPDVIDPSTENSNIDVRFHGADQLFQLWPYYRLSGETSETRFPTPDSITTEIGLLGSSLVLTWLDVFSTALPGVGPELRLSVEDCVETSCSAGFLPESEATYRAFLEFDQQVNGQIFLYQDVDLAGVASNHTARLDPFDEAIDILQDNGRGGSLSARGAYFELMRGGPPPGIFPDYRADAFPALRNELDDAALTDLGNTGVPFGPGDVTFAFQFDLNLINESVEAVEFTGTFNEPLFRDGFELGDLFEWSTTFPPPPP